MDPVSMTALPNCVISGINHSMILILFVVWTCAIRGFGGVKCISSMV